MAEEKVSEETAVTIRIPDARVYAQAGEMLAKKARAIWVASADDYQACGEDLRVIATKTKAINDALEPIISSAHQTHRQLTTLRNNALAPYDEAKRVFQAKMSTYKREEEQRIAAEKRRLEEEERRRQEALALEEAAKLEAIGDKKAAEEVVQAAIEAPPPVFDTPAPVPKVEGVSTRKRFVFSVVESHKIPRDFLMVNESAIRAVVNKLGKDAEKVIPGIEVREETAFATRAAY